MATDDTLARGAACERDRERLVEELTRALRSESSQPAPRPAHSLVGEI